MIQRSRIALRLTKEAAAVPKLPGLGMEEDPAKLVPAHGFQGRINNGAAQRVKVKMMQGPRAHAPRLAAPAP